MNEDMQLSSEILPEQIHEVHSKHFPLYVPLLVVTVIVALAFFELLVSQAKMTPQVAGDSTETTQSQETP